MSALHAPVKRIVPGAKQAVLLIHGIVGTPRMFDPCLDCISPDISVHSVLLPGHGGTAADFGRSSMDAWMAHCRHALDALRQGHERVYIVGHSLGTLIALHLAAENPDCLAGMLLLCVPLRIAPKLLPMLAKLPKGLGIGDSAAMPLHHYYGIAPEWRVWRYLRWIPRYLELFRISRTARRILPQVAVPTTALMAGRDELVSLRGADDMAASPAISVQFLPQSRHYEFPPEDANRIRSELQAMLKTP